MSRTGSGYNVIQVNIINMSHAGQDAIINQTWSSTSIINNYNNNTWPGEFNGVQKRKQL